MPKRWKAANRARTSSCSGSAHRSPSPSAWMARVARPASGQAKSLTEASMEEAKMRAMDAAWSSLQRMAEERVGGGRGCPSPPAPVSQP